MSRARLGVIARLPEPLGIHVQAWRRALGDPAAERIVPHLTLVPPQTVDERDLDRVVALVERAAVVREGGPALAALEAVLRESPLDRRTHPFHPHVTLVQDLPPDRVEFAARELAGFRAAFPVRELALMREQREPELGRVWRPLAAATVGASTAIREVPFTEAASVALLVVDPASARVLLGLRTRGQGRRYPGAWDAIGGKPEEDETLLDALSREACEEAGIEPLDLTALGCFHDGERADAYFLVTAWKGEPANREPAEHSQLEWVPLYQAGQRPLTPTVRAAVARLAAVLAAGHRLHPLG
jgi:8-oxo-dGTP pyrophosphatase MutT (NUDIX family)/2'-5' RNA ligase